MAQRYVLENGKRKLLIDVSVRCPNHPGGRIFRKKRFDDLELGSAKANSVERQFTREIEKEKSERDVLGLSWEALLNLYENEVYPKVLAGEHPQNKNTFDEALRALRKWSVEWFPVIAARLTCADVTRLFHEIKEAGCSDSFIGKVRADIKKIFDFGIIHRHIKGIEQSPTVGVTIKSRRRMRTEILGEEEIKKLLLYSREYEPKWHYIWAAAVYTGCRNGELYSLKWSDIDEKDRILTIQRSYDKKSNEYKGTKTDEWRKVSICKPLWDILQELKAMRDHDISRGACPYPEFVLPRPGHWQNGDQARILRQFCEEIGITSVCFHTLRACFATELLKRGVPVPRVMRVGGWKSIKTMMHYVRLSGVDDKGITDPLDFHSARPNQKNENVILMKAVGDKFGVIDSVASVIPLATRALVRPVK